MSLHPLRAEDEVRPCPPCRDLLKMSNCTVCNGTGQLGDPDAELVIEVFHGGGRRWHIRSGCPNNLRGQCGYATHDEALAAARKALQ